MKFKALAVALAITLLAGHAGAQGVSTGAAAASPPQFALFNEICLGHQGDYEGARAALEAHQFERSDQLIRSDEVEMQGVSYETEIDGARFLISLALTPADKAKGNPPVLLCAVTQSEHDPASLQAARAWVNLDATDRPAGQETYSWRQGAGGRVRLPSVDGPESLAAVQAGDYRQISLIVEGPTGLILISE